MVRAEGAAACPFCGSEEVYVEEYEHHPGAARWRVLCAGCMAGIDTGTRQSAGAAVQDWNRCAERMCRNFGGEEGTNGEDYDFACSACGWCGDVTEPNFCPNCGARVVGE